MTSWTCLDCGHIFLWIRKGIETRPKECPKCGSKEIDVREV